MSNRNRTAGNAYELEVAKVFDEVLNKGMNDHVITSRYNSRYKDSNCIDLDNTEMFQVQCKLQKVLPDLTTIFQTMSKFDPNKINLIFWKRTKRAEKNMVTNGEYVIMRKQDFMELSKFFDI